MAEKTLEEITEFVAGTVIRELYEPEGDYPYYFLGEQSIGWGEYIDFSNFNPFELLGFKQVRYDIEVPEEYYDEHGYDIDSDISMEINRGDSFTDIINHIKALNPVITISEKER